MENNAAESLREETARSSDTACGARMSKRNRFEDVVTLEHAKQALMQLGFKARAARAALDAACARVGGDADVALLVKTVLKQRGELEPSTADDDVEADATQAVAQLGYSHAIARTAVAAASAHVGASAELTTLIKEALRRCTSR